MIDFLGFWYKGILELLGEGKVGEIVFEDRLVYCLSKKFFFLIVFRVFCLL